MIENKKYEERLLQDIAEQEQNIERIRTSLAKIRSELRGYYTDCIREIVKEYGKDTNDDYIYNFPEDFESTDVPTIGNLVYDHIRVMLCKLRVDKETDEMFYTRYTESLDKSVGKKESFKFSNYDVPNTILKRLLNHLNSHIEVE